MIALGPTLRPSDFQESSAYFLIFPLVPPLLELARKWPILVSLLNLPELGFAGSFGSAVCAKMFSDDCA